MSKADRVIAKREREREDASAAAEAERADTARERRVELYRQMEPAINPAVASLEVNDFPGGQMLVVERKTYFGSKSVNRAGWELAVYSYLWKQVRREEHVWLISDGRLATGGSRKATYVEPDVLISGAGKWSDFPFDAVRIRLEEIARR